MMERATCCDKVNVKKGACSPKEDAIKNYLQKHGTSGNWISLPQRADMNMSKRMRLPKAVKALIILVLWFVSLNVLIEHGNGRVLTPSGGDDHRRTSKWMAEVPGTNPLLEAKPKTSPSSNSVPNPPTRIPGHRGKI